MVSGKAGTSAPAVPENAGIDWREVTNVNDALALLGNVANSADLFGDGTTLIKDKAELVGRSFIVLEWRFQTDEESNREYVNVHIMGADGSRARFNDGSTGVYSQLKELTEKGFTGGIKVPNGLRRSDYTKELADGSRSAATTFYFAQ